MTHDTQRIQQYAKLRFLNPGLSKRQCARQAGYSESMVNKINDIEKTKEYRTIRDEVTAAARQAGISPQSIMETLERSMSRSKESKMHDSTANQAAKIAGDFLGMNAAVQVDTSVNVKHSILMGILAKVDNNG